MKFEDRKNLKYFLKDDIRQETDFRRTDQNIGVPTPPIEKPAPPDAPFTAAPMLGPHGGPATRHGFTPRKPGSRRLAG